MSMNEKEGMLKFSVQTTLEKLCPDMFRLMEGQTFPWKDINKKFAEKLSQRKKDFTSNGNYLKVEINFYDLIVGVLQNNPSSIRFFLYIRIVTHSLNERLSQEEKKLVGKIIRRLLTDFTRDYIHNLGELFYLKEVIESGHYKLRGIEDKRSNGKEIDFKFLDLRDKREYLVEIMNVRLNPEKLNSHSDIKNYLAGKVKDKVVDKTKNQKFQCDFLVLPILWGEKSEHLLKVFDFYKNGSGLNISMMLEPFSYCCWDDEQLRPIFKFSIISELFNAIE